MTHDPLAGRRLGALEASRMLVATEDGVCLWPAITLVERRGNGFVAMEPREVNNLIGAFFGPDALRSRLLSVLESARDQLRLGWCAAVQRELDRLLLPPVASNGERLMRAIASRHGLVLPDVVATTEQSGTIWGDRDIDNFVHLHDDLGPEARALQKAFNPGSAWDPAKHPRWPSGEPDGGRFRPGDGAGEGSASPIRPASAAGQIIASQVLGDPPKIPGAPPATEAARNAIRKAVVVWLARAALATADIASPEVVLAVEAAVEGAAWLAPYVKAYFDNPKTLEELQSAVDTPRNGTDVHHIVEQTSARKDKFPESQIEDPSNLVRISRLKHWELNRWYETPNEDYGNQTPRQYVKGKNWETRRQVGLEGLKDVGVLKK